MHCQTSGRQSAENFQIHLIQENCINCPITHPAKSLSLTDFIPSRFLLLNEQCQSVVFMNHLLSWKRLLSLH